MKTQKSSIIRPGIVSGLMLALTLIFYFLLMKLMGFSQNADLRYLNFFIVSVGVGLTLRYYRSKNDSEISYLPGFGLGFMSGGIGTILFSVFMYNYFLWFDPSFLAQLKPAIAWDGNLITPGIAAITLLAEGLGSSIVISYVFMQYFKKDIQVAKKRRIHPEMRSHIH